MLGENFYGPRAMQEAIRVQACDLVMPDLMRIGGVTGFLRAAALADVAGIPMSSHLYPEVSGHLLRVTPTRLWLPGAVKPPPDCKDPNTPVPQTAAPAMTSAATVSTSRRW